jgi:hypothetical protein
MEYRIDRDALDDARGSRAESPPTQLLGAAGDEDREVAPILGQGDM